MSAIGNNIKRHRKARNMTQADLAEKIGVDNSAVSMWERGKNEPRMGMIVKVADALGIAVSDITEGIDAPRISRDDEDILRAYHALNQQGKAYIRQQLQIAQQLYTGDTACEVTA